MLKVVKFKFYEGNSTPLASSSCLITISVGQESHENDRLLSTFLKVNSIFNSCNICICDTLQRYSFGLLKKVSMEDAYKYTKELGDEWIERNKTNLNQLTIPYKISRWTEWMSSIEYKSIHEFLRQEYITNESFKNIMDYTINEFYIRQKKKDYMISYDEVHAHSLEYLLEECAVQSIIAKNNFNYELYPSKRNPILSYSYKNYIKNPNVLKPISIKFETKKNYKIEN